MTPDAIEMNLRPTLSWRFAAFLAAVAALGGCASTPELIAKSPVAPEGVNLDGFWQLREDSQAPQPELGERDPGIRIPPRVSAGSRAEDKRHPPDSGSSVWLFLETGASLKITQTRYGMFISFDRAIVEEYTFGEKRVVSIGPVEAQRASGWDGERFVVETLDEGGALLSESWRLRENGQELLRDIVMKRKGRDPVIVRQRFDRRDAE